MVVWEREGESKTTQWGGATHLRSRAGRLLRYKNVGGKRLVSMGSRGAAAV